MRRVRGVLLDLDGTLYQGNAAIPGAVEALARLRAAGVPYRLVTNTTSRSRATLVDRLRGYGFDLSPRDLFSAPVAAARLARERGHRVVAPFLPPAALVDLEGLILVGGTSGASGPAPTAVLLGDLGERWTYALLQEAFEHLMAGAELLTCSRDRYFRGAGGLALDAGPFVAALEYAAGATATVAGKPSATFFRAAAESLAVEVGSTPVVMVGDDLWSDVQGAQGAGLEGWLVRTGKFRADALADSGIVPDRVLESVAELPGEVIVSA
jgi:HAD superfamily hydrolase (TIGR01458 family)